MAKATRNDAQIIRFDNPAFKFFIAVPRIAKLDLNPFEFKLYAHYIDEITWRGGEFQQGCRATDDILGMDRDTVSKAQKGLVEKGYAKLIPGDRPDKPSTVTLLTSIWAKNYLAYAKDEDKRDLALAIVEQVSNLPGMADELMDTLVEKNATCGGNKGQPGGNTSQGWPENPPLSYIEDLEIDSLADDPVSEPTAARSNSRPGQQDRVKGKRFSPSKEKEEPAATTSTLHTHPLAKLFREETGVQLLTPEMSKLLTEMITIVGEDAKQIYPSLVRMWDERDGFSAFITARIAENKAARDLMTPINLLKHLRKFGKDTGMIGWLAWKAKHPELCNRHVTELEEPITIAGSPLPEFL